MEPQAWTTPTKNTHNHDAASSTGTSFTTVHADGEDIDTSSTWASLIKAVIIGGLLIVLFYLYYNTSEQTQANRQPAPEEIQEARRKRLEKLEREAKAVTSITSITNTTKEKQVKASHQPSAKPEPKTTPPSSTSESSGGNPPTAETKTESEASVPVARATSTTTASEEESEPGTSTLSQPSEEPVNIITQVESDDEDEDDDDMQILRLKRPPPPDDSHAVSATAARAKAAAEAEARAAKKRHPSPIKSSQSNGNDMIVAAAADESDVKLTPSSGALKRPPPKSAPLTKAAPGSEPASSSKPTTSLAATTSRAAPAKPVPSEEAATTTSTSTKKRKSGVKSKKPPRETLLQAMSSITGMIVTTPSSPPATKTTTSTKTSTTIKLVLSDSALPSSVSWKDIIISSSATASTLFQPFQSQLTGNRNATKKKPTTTYGPTKLVDRRLYKASDWYQKCKTWVRDHSSLVDEEGKEGLERTLEEFQKWIIETLVAQFQVDVSKLDDTNNKTASNAIDDDDDVDMGLFADEAYGGIFGGGQDTSHQHQSKQANDDDDNDSLFGELLFLLADASGPKVLTKPFLAHIIQTYDAKFSAAASSASSSPSSSLGNILLQECLQRLPKPEQKAKLEWEATQKHITAITNLLTLSPDAVKALAGTILPTTDDEIPTEGKTWEEQSSLRELLCLAAWTVPRLNNNKRRRLDNNAAQQHHRMTDPNELLPQSYHANLVDAMGKEYPVCLYASQGYDDARRNYNGMTKHAQSILKLSRGAGSLALKKMAATTTHPALRKGGLLFDWIGYILETNEPLVDMLQSDLLSSDSAQALCASRPFLLGMTSCLLQVCTTNLTARIADDGMDAFDYRYFVKENRDNDDGGGAKQKKKTGIVIPSQERCLIEVTTNNNDKKGGNDDRPSRFSGATEFFMLTAGLLRISLFPGFRVDEEFRSTLRHVFSSIQQLASQQPTAEQLRTQIRDNSMQQMQKVASVGQGWQTFVDDPEMSPMITTFSLLQLQWVSLAVSSTADKGGAAAALIPEWFVKLPSQWLAHVAKLTPHLLEPRQGIDAVEFATRILQAGTTKSTHFSPPVLCQLIRIAGAFVYEGVRRARHREKSKSHHHHQRGRGRGRRGGGFQNQPPPPPQGGKDDDEDFEMDLIDDRTLDIYHSFDARDLGITVFTNEFVAKHLCPTLMRAYMAMDAVEGMDVEREYHFEKFQVKHDVADLLLRLWCHPNGQSREATVTDLDELAMNEFCSSVAGALGFQLDQSCQFILDIRDIKDQSSRQAAVSPFAPRGPPGQPRLSPRDAAAIDHHANFLSFSLYQCRRLLLILCEFSKEDTIAAVLGGKASSSNKSVVVKSAAPDLANMFLNLMERLTDEDGAIHPELEMRQLKPEERSAVLLSQLDTTTPDKLQPALRYLLHSRRFALLEYGLDVSLLSHQFLALAARWHLAAASIDKEGKRTSKLLDAMVASDICDSKRLRNVFRRLVVGADKELSGSELDNAAYILERDGHVDLTIWKESYKIEGGGPDKGKHRKRQAKQDRMSHSDLESLAEMKDIQAFLDDLEQEEASKKSFAVAARWGTKEMQRLEESFLTTGDLLDDDDYTESLKEWVVSSDSFLSSAGNGSFAHSYDSLVRGRGAGGMGAGKILAKEARKCFRLIPKPHPNTSVFVCFAEERTDLCKAIIIGAADTPFSMGMFEFDILFPTNYPQSPPLFNFKTTGDGRTRISSNLYTDGKVCISILGTYQAFDDSQRWNPSTSSLAQVLASLQTQLLGDAEPYFSDGFNHDSVRGTPAGEKGSERFNNKIRLHTLRYAIIAPLKHPPLGFDEVTKRHFALCRKRVLAQARLWTVQAQGTPLYKSFVQAYEELITLLSNDDLVRHKAPGRTEDKPWGAVPLHTEDYQALEESDRTYVQLHKRALEGCLATDAKPAASAGVAAANDAVAPPINLGWGQAPPSNNTNQMPLNYNPWAVGGSGVGSAGQDNFASASNATDDDDDFDDMYA